MGREDHRRALQELAHRAGMNRPGAAKGEQRKPAMIDATIGGMGAHGGRHGFGNDAIDAAGGVGQIGAELVAQALDRGFGGRLVELHAAAEEIVGIEQAQHDIGVGDGRLGAAAAIGSRTRRRAGAARADLKKAEIVDMGDGTAAGADLDHVDGRHGQRHAAALAEAIHAIDFEARR